MHVFVRDSRVRRHRRPARASANKIIPSTQWFQLIGRVKSSGGPRTLSENGPNENRRCSFDQITRWRNGDMPINSRKRNRNRKRITEISARRVTRRNVFGKYVQTVSLSYSLVLLSVFGQLIGADRFYSSFVRLYPQMFASEISRRCRLGWLTWEAPKQCNKSHLTDKSNQMLVLRRMKIEIRTFGRSGRLFCSTKRKRECVRVQNNSCSFLLSLSERT